MKDMKQTARILGKVLKFFLILVRIAIVCLIAGLCLAVPFLFWSGPDKGELIAGLVILLICLFAFYAAQRILKGIRAILAPIIQGAPFHAIVGEQLKKLTKDLCILGVSLNLADILLNHLLVVYDARLTAAYNIDLSFLLYAGFLHLLGQIFEYGAELQKLSDETLSRSGIYAHHSAAGPGDGRPEDVSQ